MVDRPQCRPMQVHIMARMKAPCSVSVRNALQGSVICSLPLSRCGSNIPALQPFGSVSVSQVFSVMHGYGRQPFVDCQRNNIPKFPPGWPHDSGLYLNLQQATVKGKAPWASGIYLLLCSAPPGIPGRWISLQCRFAPASRPAPVRPPVWLPDFPNVASLISFPSACQRLRTDRSLSKWFCMPSAVPMQADFHAVPDPGGEHSPGRPGKIPGNITPGESFRACAASVDRAHVPQKRERTIARSAPQTV